MIRYGFEIEVDMTRDQRHLCD